MRTRILLPFVLLVLVEYATTTSIADQLDLQRVSNSNARPTTIQQSTVHLYRESPENDQEDTVEDAELSPSEVFETLALPETPDPDDTAAAAGSGVGAGVQRVRRRRRRRRRKRPKSAGTAATGMASVSAASAATIAPAKSPNRFDAYYAVAEDQARRKPFKYHRAGAGGGGAADENAETAASQTQLVDGYARRRPTKRRRRPHKKPVDDHPPPASFDDEEDAENGDGDGDGDLSWTNAENHRSENATAAVPATTAIPIITIASASADSSGGTRRPDLFKSTTAANRNKLSPSKEDASQSSETTSAATAAAVDIVPREEDSENSLKRRKRPAAHKIQSENDENASPSNRQHMSSLEQNVVVRLGHEENSKSIDNRKELFKLRRLPPTWAILGHAKVGQSASTKNESAIDKNANHHNASKQIVREQSEAIAAAPVTAAASKNNLVRESQQRPAAAASFKTSTTTTTTVGPPSVSIDESKTTAADKKSNNSGIGGDTPGERIPLSVITTYAGPRQRVSKTAVDVDVNVNAADVVNSNASAFLSANEQRLTIIYVPCNQTVTSSSSSSSSATAAEVDKLLKNGGSFFGPTNEDFIRSSGAFSATESSPTTESTAPETRKISTTRLPSSEQRALSDESASEKRLEDATKSSSAVDTAASTPTPNASREPKRYHDDVASDFKSKLESVKEEQPPSWQIRKPYPSPVLNAASAKPFVGSSKEIIISYTSTTNAPPSLFSYHNVDSADEQISLRLRNHNNSRISGDGSTENTLVGRIKQHHHYQQHQQHQQHQQQHHVERKKLPLAVKSAIIISGAVLALAVLGFFALLLSCKIRQAKSRMKCHRQLYRDQFQSSEFRQSSRSTSPVMSKSNYNTRNFTNNMQPANVAAATASNRNYYLWQTLRKTFQYD